MNDDLYFDGKKYISSRRAAKISGYVNDYIGQLCRDGKLDCRMVGRSWYVGLESLVEHKSSNLVGTRSKGSLNKKILAEDSAKVDIVTTPKIEQEGLLNFSVESNVVTFISPVVETPILIEPVVKGALVSYPDYEKFEKSVSYPVFTPIISDVPGKKLGIFSSAGMRLFVGTIAILISLSGFQSTVSDVKGSSSNNAGVFSSTVNTFERVSAFAYNVAHDLFTITKEKVLVLAGKEVAPKDSPTVNTNVSSNNVAVRPSQGLVVVPMDENTDKAAVVAKIKNTFSDEVSVNPDDKESGVITPVFKESKGDDYLYVLVPIKN